MEDQCSTLSWGYYFQDEGLEELKHSLLYTTLELQATMLSAQDELARKEDEIFQFKNLVIRIAKERDEAQEKCQTLLLEKLLLHQQLQQQKQPNMIDVAISSGTTSTEDEQRKRDNSNIFQYSSSDCDESFISSPSKDLLAEVNDKLTIKKPLPEKGKFLQAVMEAGPLLQTLLLAGPLPQWQHPPPQLNTLDIPPVTINSSSPNLTPRLLHQDSSPGVTNCGGGFSKKKRVLDSPNTTINVDQGFDSSPISNSNKYQKVVQHSSLTNNF